jgi:polyhydroxybutyrate depolymerase
MISPMRALALVSLLLVTTAHAESPLVQARPYFSRTPARWDPTRPAPLLILLHPYYPGGGREAAAMYQLAPILDLYGLLFAAPDGTLEAPGGNRFWNATDACCAWVQSVDDVTYLDAVVADLRARWRVDPKRIFLIGYSNGGFMTHRLLCERASLFAGGASIAGAAWGDPSRCRPSAPAALLEVHGDADSLVREEGGTFRNGARYPSSMDGVGDWASKIGCTGAPKPMGRRDLMPNLSGPETEVARWSCPRGAAELWTVHGGPHVGLSPTMRAAIEWLLAHPRD